MSHVSHVTHESVKSGMQSHLDISAHVTYNMHESCHMSMSHVTHMNESSLACSHVLTSRLMSHQWLMSHINEPCHKSISHVTHMSVSCVPHIQFGCVMSHQRFMSQINESCHTYEWAMSHIWMCHVYAFMSRHLGACPSTPHTVWACDVTSMIHVTNQWAMSHIWMSHVTHMNASYVCIHVPTSTCMSEYPTYSLSVYMRIHSHAHKYAPSPRQNRENTRQHLNLFKCVDNGVRSRPSKSNDLEHYTYTPPSRENRENTRPWEHLYFFNLVDNGLRTECI